MQLIRAVVKTYGLRRSIGKDKLCLRASCCKELTKFSGDVLGLPHLLAFIFYFLSYLPLAGTTKLFCYDICTTKLNDKFVL